MPTTDPKAPRPAGAAIHLGRATSTELTARAQAVLLVPVGSCEQHGPHLPLDTDTTIARALAERVAAEHDDVVVGPPVCHGASGEHQGFPGTLSIGAEALTTVLVELGRSAFPPDGGQPFAALVFVNGHGGNLFAVRRAVEVLVSEGRPVSSWAPRVDGGDAHAGRTETSLMLAVDPSAVRSARPVGRTEALSELLPELRAGGVVAVSPSGVLGDASGASADEGRRILASLVADLGAHLAAGGAA